MASKYRNGIRRAFVGACIASSFALAGTTDAQWGGDWRRDRHTARDVEAVLILNGERICIDGHSIVNGIAEALRCKGYRVSVCDGAVMVHYRGHAPRVSLAGCDYNLSVTRSRGCLVLKPYRIDYRRGGYDRDWRRDRGHDRHWDRRPHFRWRSSPSCGFTIRIGG